MPLVDRIALEPPYLVGKRVTVRFNGWPPLHGNSCGSHRFNLHHDRLAWGCVSVGKKAMSQLIIITADSSFNQYCTGIRVTTSFSCLENGVGSWRRHSNAVEVTHCNPHSVVGEGRQVAKNHGGIVSLLQNEKRGDTMSLSGGYNIKKKLNERLPSTYQSLAPMKRFCTLPNVVGGDNSVKQSVLHRC